MASRLDASLKGLTWASVGGAVLAVAVRATGDAPRAAQVVGVAASVLVAARVLVTTALAAKGRVPWTRLPFAWLIAVEACLYMLGVRYDARVARGGLVAIELGVVAYAIAMVARARGARRDGPLEERLASTLDRVLPPGIARFIAGECAIVAAAFAGEGRAHGGGDARSFGYVAESPLKMFVLAFPFLIVGDELLAQVVVPSTWVAVHVLIAASSLYGYVWIIGIYRTMTARPHLLGATTLRLHRGILCSAEIARDDVLSAAPLGDEARPARAARFDLPGAQRVVLSLKSPVACRGLFAPRAPASTLVVSVDDPAAFCDALTTPARAPG
jgi:hypothetical protein